MALNPQTHSSNSLPNNNLTSGTLAGYTPAAGDNKILVVRVGVEKTDSGTPPVITSVTFGGVALVQRARATESTSLSNVSEIWDLPIGGSVTSGDIVVSTDVGVAEIIFEAACYAELAQQAPEVTAQASSTTSPINTSITTLTDGAIIVDCLGEGRGTDVAITQGPGQVMITEIQGSTSSLGTSEMVATTAGSHTLGWSIVSPLRNAHVLAAYAPAGGGSVFSDTQILFDMVGQVSSDNQINFDLLNIANSDLQTVFDIKNTANSDISAPWDMRSFASSDMQIVFDISGLTSVSSDVQAVFDIFNRVSSDVALQWDIFTTVLSDIEAPFDIRSTVTGDTEISFDIRELTQSDIELLYDMAGSVFSDSQIVFDLGDVGGGGSGRGSLNIKLKLKL